MTDPTRAAAVAALQQVLLAWNIEYGKNPNRASGDVFLEVLDANPDHRRALLAVLLPDVQRYDWTGELDPSGPLVLLRDLTEPTDTGSDSQQ